MKIENFRDLLKAAQGVRDLRNRAFEHNIKPGNYNSEVEKVLNRADEILKFTLVLHKDSINKKLNLFEDTLRKIAEPNSSPEVYLEEKLSNCLRRLIIQECRVIESGTNVTGKLGSIYNEESLKKLINGLIFDFYRALKTSKKHNLSSSYTNKMLDKLHVVSPIAVDTLLNKFRNSPLPKTLIEGAAVNFTDAEKRIMKMEKDYLRLSEQYKNHPYVSKSIINRYILDLSPDESIKIFLENLNTALEDFRDVSKRIVIKEVSSNPKNYQRKLELYRENMGYMNENEIYLHSVAKEFFALRAKNKEELLKFILEYKKRCEILENEAEFKSFIYLIRRLAHDKSLDELRTFLRKIRQSIEEVMNNPDELPEEYRSNTTNIERVIVSYGSERLLEKLKDISNKYRNLTKYFLENDKTFREIYDLYKVNLIDIFYVSPIRTEEENKIFFQEKITTYGKLLRRLVEKYGQYTEDLGNRRGRNDNPQQEAHGYLAVLIRAIYREDPEAYLKENGFEI